MITDKRFLPDLSQLTYGQMRNAILGLDVRVSSALLPDRTYGLYDESKRLILIDRRMTYTRKRCTLMHELVHWLHGDQTCTGVIGNRHERRTRPETARRLISPLEYATAETIWDGKPGLIAGELNVTQEIVEDYRSMLHDMIPHEREKALHGAATP